MVVTAVESRGAIANPKGAILGREAVRLHCRRDGGIRLDGRIEP